VTPPVLSVEDLQVTYQLGARELPAIRGVDLTVSRGEIVGLLGESGCGKSTLGLAIPRLLPPNGSVTGGRILLEGRDLIALSDTEMRSVRGAGIGMIFQDPLTSLNPTFSIGTQMTAALRAHQKAPRKELQLRASEMLTQVGIPDAPVRLRAHPHQFSGGMNQRIMIGTALALRPALMIADEPTSALDVTLQAEIVELLMKLRDDFGTSIVIISHDPVVLARACDRLVVMYAGQVVEEAATDTILGNPKHPYTVALLDAFPSSQRRQSALPVIPGQVPALWAWSGGCTFADRCQHVLTTCREATPPLVEVETAQVRCVLFAGRAGSEAPRVPASPSTPATAREGPDRAPELEGAGEEGSIVEVRGLRCHFFPRRSVLGRLLHRSTGAVRAVDGVDLDIVHGEILGLVGESGSGKTTLGRTLLRLIPATEGTVVFRGQDLASVDRRDLQRLRCQMQLIAQDAYGSLSPRKRVEQLLQSPYKIHSTPKDQRYSVTELLEMVELRPDLATKLPHELSGGQARRIGVARALALRPSLVVADEPTSGLDASAAASVLNLLKSLRDELHLTFLVITHDLNVVGYLADRVAVMYLGKVIEIGRAREVLEAPAHPYTQALLTAHAADASAADGSVVDDTQRARLKGEIPSPINPPAGCRFHTRCPFTGDRCDTAEPILEAAGDGHIVACHHWRAISAGSGSRT
jgi:peptide/nickel transport system ATP-binding protein